MLHRIQYVEVLPGHKLRLSFEDGGAGVVDLAAIVQQGGVFTPLRDVKAFSQVSIGERGRSLQWPGEIDLCADALRLEIESAQAL